MPTGARQMQHWAVQRDEQKGQAFYAELMSFYNLEDLLTFDETANSNTPTAPHRSQGGALPSAPRHTAPPTRKR